MLSYLLWEIHDYSFLPIIVEIGDSGYRVTHGWGSHGAPMVQWKSLPESDRTQIEHLLEQVDFWEWETSYSDRTILDGTTWSIKVRAGRNGGRRKSCYGVNGFPKGWDKVRETIMALAR